MAEAAEGQNSDDSLNSPICKALVAFCEERGDVLGPSAMPQMVSLPHEAWIRPSVLTKDFLFSGLLERPSQSVQAHLQSSAPACVTLFMSSLLAGACCCGSRFHAVHAVCTRLVLRAVVLQMAGDRCRPLWPLQCKAH